MFVYGDLNFIFNNNIHLLCVVYLVLLLLVGELVFVQIGRVDECGRTVLTFVRFLPGVGSHVHHQVVLVLAFVGAQVTVEVKGVCVNQPVG